MEPIERIFIALVEEQIRRGYSLRDAANTAYGQMVYSEIGQDNAVKHFEKLRQQLHELKTAPGPEPEPVEAVEEELAELVEEEELPGAVEKSVTKTRK